VASEEPEHIEGPEHVGAKSAHIAEPVMIDTADKLKFNGSLDGATQAYIVELLAC
jgi:hypothetical protein